MKFSQEFAVGKPLPVVWGLFHDVPAVAQCLPGAELTDDKGGGAYAGQVSVKLGPLNPTFEGEAVIIFDEDDHEVIVNGSGVDRQGGSRGRAEVRVGLHERDLATTVSVNATVTLSGAAARFGRTGLMEEMAARMIDDFVRCLETKLAAATPTEADAVEAKEVRGISLFVSAVIAWLRRVTRRFLRRTDAG